MTQLKSSNGLVTFNVLMDGATHKPKPKRKKKPKDGTAGPKALSDLLKL